MSKRCVDYLPIARGTGGSLDKINLHSANGGVDTRSGSNGGTV